MPEESRIVRPGREERSVRTMDGQVLIVPEGWILLPPGDAGLTRRVKSAGPTWTVQEKVGRKVFSRGVWAPADRVEIIRKQLEDERSTASYAKKRAAETARRERKQSEYVDDFHASVMSFLNFAPCYHELAIQLATAVTRHATPVGSGTVARTERIPITQRAESAVIAWLRHQTTTYDLMRIPRVKGKRREVRRMLAEQSRRLLDEYRRGHLIDEKSCLLRQALDPMHLPLDQSD
ncbi:DUF2293 domain-containing protein [bacterium]|nr:DUF2293 domain-containing protein [bacterium]